MYLRLPRDVRRALRLRAAACNRSISDMVNEAVCMTLAEDVDDLRDVNLRQDDDSIAFEEFVARLGNSGRIYSYHQALYSQGAKGNSRDSHLGSFDR